VLTLLPQLGLSLLHGSNNHVANTSIGQPVEVGTEAERFDEEQGLGTAVICAIDNSANGQTKGHAEF